MGGRGVNKIGTSEFQYDFKKKEGLFCEFQRKFCTFFNKVTLLLDSVLTVYLCEHGVLLTDCLLFIKLNANKQSIMYAAADASLPVKNEKKRTF